MLFAIKKAVALAMSPLVVALTLSIVAALLGWRGRRRLSAWLFGSAGALLLLAALPPVSDALIGPLEHNYTGLERAPAVGFTSVVVLGTGYTPQRGVPVTGALEDDGLARIVEGVRLMRLFRAERLVVSGGARPGRTPTAHGYARLASELGVARDSVLILDTALDTQSESKAVRELLGNEPFVLVTSAYHMRRAMWLMERAGCRPIAAPTGQTVKYGADHDWAYFLPTTRALRNTERALHEYLGLALLSLGISP